ncbi:MAG: cystathionine beta-lyase [Alphaproteobacteria bacterium]|nr:cystathionine beta-lyase [Alphaproteobacteria bacterium]MDE1985677.1 cystathionine beta-lyase [Alphaproteobacteria bacterium]MDE2161870.1 cystathionine beta-lyase [Alphaproteobacteria bacterium]MDE2264941.1 cystathionine beta-lyase [Alphaproteobacteria bacterium]
MSEEHFGTVNTPVYRTSTILLPNVASLKSGNAPYVYGRRGTPTTRSFEDAISTLEGAARTVSLPSGLNAIATAIMSVCRAGDHLLMVDSCYGPTRHFCDTVLKRFGVETTYYDPSIGADITSLFQANTRAVYCESPGSLTFEIQDVPAIAEAAHARDASVLMDNTWGTPIFFPALKRGVDLSIHAATKYICGHSDVMMGTISANEKHAKRLSDFVGELGLYVGGDDCFLALRGLRTLPVRLKRHQETALRLTRWLSGRPEVSRVLYPALETDPGHALWKRDFLGACGLFGVVLKPFSDKAVTAMIDGMRHFGIGWSWGGYESLIIPSEFERTACKFNAAGPVIRVHAGLEDPDDLLADLEDGLARLRSS